MTLDSSSNQSFPGITSHWFCPILPDDVIRRSLTNFWWFLFSSYPWLKCMTYSNAFCHLLWSTLTWICIFVQTFNPTYTRKLPVYINRIWARHYFAAQSVCTQSIPCDDDHCMMNEEICYVVIAEPLGVETSPWPDFPKLLYLKGVWPIWAQCDWIFHCAIYTEGAYSLMPSILVIIRYCYFLNLLSIHFQWCLRWPW